MQIGVIGLGRMSHRRRLLTNRRHHLSSYLQPAAFVPAQSDPTDRIKRLEPMGPAAR
jgi:hypothetical protein